MKHTLKVTLALVAFFFLAQVVGLLIVNQYIDHKKTVEANDGDIAGFGENWLVVTPSFARVDRGLPTDKPPAAPSPDQETGRAEDI